MRALAYILLIPVLLLPALRANAQDDLFSEVKEQVEAVIAESDKYEVPNSIYYGATLLQAASIIENAYYYPGHEPGEAGQFKINELNALIDLYKANKGHNGDALRRSIESMVNDLPRGKGECYLDLSEPSLLVQEWVDKDVILYFRGDFASLNLEDSYLKVNGTQIPIAHRTNTSLSISTSWRELGISDTTNKIAHLYSSLVLAYEGKKADSRKQDWTDSYDIMIGIIPAGPGKLSFSNTYQANMEEMQRKTTRNYLQHSSNGDIVENYCVPDHPGWEIVPGSVQLIVDASSGMKDQDWFITENSRGGKSCFTVETIFNSLGTSGKLSFHIVYEIRRSSQTSNESKQSAAITWGESFVFDVYSPDWKLQLDSFTGEKQELSLTQQQSGLLELKLYGNTLRVTAMNIKDLIHPQ